MGIIWDSATGGFVARDEVYQFTIDEPVNYTEHDAWIEQLEPVWSWPDDCIGSFLVGVYVGEYPQFERGEWCSVTSAPLTVEYHDVEPTRRSFNYIKSLHQPSHLDAPYYDGHDNCEFCDTMLEVFALAKLPTTTAHVSPCEVTL